MNSTKFGARYTLLNFLSFCLNPFVIILLFCCLLFESVKQKDYNKRIQTKGFKQQTTKQQQRKKYKKALIVKHIILINLHTEGEFFNNLKKNYYL